jgi:hypothetical protein
LLSDKLTKIVKIYKEDKIRAIDKERIEKLGKLLMNPNFEAEKI